MKILFYILLTPVVYMGTALVWGKIINWSNDERAYTLAQVFGVVVVLAFWAFYFL